MHRSSRYYIHRYTRYREELMAVDKGYMSGSSQMLVLNLLNEKSCYGYELIKTLKQKSNDVFGFTV